MYRPSGSREARHPCASLAAPPIASIVARIEEAAVSPAALTAYIADDGAFIHPLESAPDPRLKDRDLMVYGLKSGYGRKGATIGTRCEGASLFRADMIAFWQRTLQP